MSKMEIKLENGEIVQIEFDSGSSEQIGSAGSGLSGIVETSGASRGSEAVEKITNAVTELPEITLKTFGSSVASFAKSVMGGMRQSLPEEEADIKVEFGASISLKGGFSLVSVGANASVKVTVSTK